MDDGSLSQLAEGNYIPFASDGSDVSDDEGAVPICLKAISGAMGSKAPLQQVGLVAASADSETLDPP